MTLYAHSLADEMEEAFRSEWNAEKSIPLPVAGEKDRKILFAAVARGILKYLKDNEADLITTVNTDTVSGHSHTLTRNNG